MICVKYVKGTENTTTHKVPYNGSPFSRNCNDEPKIPSRSHTFLHLMDICTRLLPEIFVPNKNKGTILKVIFWIWIAVYGSPDKILVYNGEFANTEFSETSDYLDINIQTAPESPWSNGIVERNSQTLANMMNKITQC